jgi:hypothetical protein
LHHHEYVLVFLHVITIFSPQAVLHPRHKLAYFKAQGWEEARINTAHKIICDEYTHSYLSTHLNGHRDSDDDYITVGSIDSVSVRPFLLHTLVTYSLHSRFHLQTTYLTTFLIFPVMTPTFLLSISHPFLIFMTHDDSSWTRCPELGDTTSLPI